MILKFPIAEILHEAEELWERQSNETSSEAGSASTGTSDLGDMTPPRKPVHQHRGPPKVCQFDKNKRKIDFNGFSQLSFYHSPL